MGRDPEQLGATSARLFFIYFSGSPPTETAKYVDPGLHHGARDVLRAATTRATTSRASSSAAKEFIAANPMEKATFKLAGGLIGVLAAANEELVRNDILMNILGFGTIYVIVLFTYRSFDGRDLPAAAAVHLQHRDQRRSWRDGASASTSIRCRW